MHTLIYVIQVQQMTIYGLELKKHVTYTHTYMNAHTK